MNYFLGVELNGSSLKIAAFRKAGQSHELVKLDTLTLPNESGEASKELSNWVGRNLSEVNSIKAVLTVSESTLYIKEMEFPKMTPEKLNEAIFWEIPSIAPIPQSDTVFDWQIMSESKGMSNVLVIVGKSSSIQNLIQTFRNAQIDIVAIEPSSYAFARIANAPFDTNTLVCLVQEQGTDFVILKNGVPFFTTSITGSAQSEIVSQIKSGTDLTVGIANEGKKIINYWEGKESLKINQVVIAGDLIYKYFGLTASFNLFPPIPTYVGTNRKIKGLRISGYNDIEVLNHLISIGAAVRHLQKEVLDGLNLFPPIEKQKTEKIRAQKRVVGYLMTFVYANLGIVILIIISAITFNIWWYSLEKQLTKLENAISTRSTSTLIEEVKSTNLAIDNFTLLTKQQDDYGAKLKLISDMTPQTVSLKSISLISLKNQEWTIEGVGDRNSILAFYKKISQNVKKSDISISYSSFNKPNENDFSIAISW